jgi:hypothetical protein
MAEREVQIMRSSGTPDPIPLDVVDVIAQVTEYLDSVEGEVVQGIIEMMRQMPLARNRPESDRIFGEFTSFILVPYSHRHMGSRAAFFARTSLIPAVLAAEVEIGRQFHKGALFYDTALAHLISGDDDRFEYFLAMTDEEDNLTHQIEGRGPTRGQTNLRAGDLSSQTITNRLSFLTEYLNGTIAGLTTDFAHLFGSAVSEVQLDAWRRTLEPFHHFEFFRLLQEIEVFSGHDAPAYTPVLDNPYVMLRLVKSLAHAAQWVESDLTRLQGGGGDSLSPKLNQDPDFSILRQRAGGDAAFAGGMRNLSSAALNAELGRLLREIDQSQNVDEIQWRVIRLLYLARNSTAHAIDPALDYHRDRALALRLLQTVLFAAFVIRQKKNAPFPS